MNDSELKEVLGAICVVLSRDESLLRMKADCFRDMQADDKQRNIQGQKLLDCINLIWKTSGEVM